MGESCGGPLAPKLAITPPVTGDEVVFALDSQFADAMAFVVVGLPATPPLLVVGGCPIFVDLSNFVVFSSFMTDSAGDWSMVLPLPLDPSLDGLTFIFQSSVWLPAGDSVGNAVHVRIGCDTGDGFGGGTPGFWKQPQHFSAWPAPYTPSTLFSSVFDDAFPGLTLLDVLNLGGAGLDALGRATVAALLNANDPTITFNLTDTQVVTLFNGVFPGSSSDYEALKDTLDEFNNQDRP
jgi:hypothetical protein